MGTKIQINIKFDQIWVSLALFSLIAFNQWVLLLCVLQLNDFETHAFNIEFQHFILN
jgi:hypothetical protein